MQCLMVHQYNPIFGITLYFFKPGNEINQSRNLTFGLDGLVVFEVFQHSITVNSDNLQLVPTAGSKIQIPARHNILRKLLIRCVCCNLQYLINKTSPREVKIPSYNTIVANWETFCLGKYKWRVPIATDWFC